MRIAVLAVFAALTLAAQSERDPRITAARNAASLSDWVQLFDGKSLNGWLPKITGYELNDNFANTFRVENGVMKIAYDGYGGAFKERFGHIFYKQPFTHYIIGVEYRFTGDQCPGGPGWAARNSGIMIHCQTPQSMTKDQDFPISIEVQLLGGLGKGPRPTANLCTPGTNVEIGGRLFTQHCLDSSSKTYDGDQWVRVEVEVLGAEAVRHLVEGKVVLSYQKPQIGGGNVSKHAPSAKQDGKLLAGGYISLQSESHPVEFRKVELLNLSGCMDTKSPRYKPWYVHSDPDDCR